MLRRLLVLAVFGLAAAGSLSAQGFSISYLDGRVETRTPKGWTALGIGDIVAADAQVRVSDGGALELQKGKVRITILKDGTYDIANLARASDRPGAGAVGMVLVQKLHGLTSTASRGGTTGGVRGAAQGSDADVTWVDESDETLSRARSLIDQKKFPEAVALLGPAIDDSGSDAEKVALTCLIATAWYGQGQPARAYRALSTIAPAPGSEWYPRVVVLKAQVLVDAGSYADALVLLSPFIAAYPTGESAQAAYLLSYYCQKALGDLSSAHDSLENGFRIDPSTETAKLIDNERKAQ